MTSKKKLVFVIADITCVGGIERVNTLLANELIKKHNVEILSLYKTNKEINYKLSDNVKVKYINDISYSGRPGGAYRLFKHLKMLRRLTGYLVSLRDSIIIVNTFPLATLAYLSTFISKNKYIVIEHVHFKYYHSLLRWVRGIIYKNFFSVVVLTDDDFLFYKKDHRNVIKIQNPLSFDVVEKADVKVHKIVAVGRLEKQKGFDLLVKAFSCVGEDVRRGWSIDIYGGGGEKNNILNLIETLGVSSQIQLCGTVNNMSEIYNKYSIFVFSSRFEGFGMVLVEAMASGLPCISFDCPSGPKEILNNGEFGVLVENENVYELSKALDLMMSSYATRSLFAEKSLSRSKDFYISEVIKKWESLFANLNNEI